MIKYLGSKRRLIDEIVAAIAGFAPSGTVLDLFSGTSRVGHALKSADYRVLANDHNAYAATLATCYVQADRDEHEALATRLLEELRREPPRAGWFTETYCVRSRYLHPDNGARVEGMRERIASWALEPELEAILLTALLEAADRVDSTTGVQMAYLKQWAPRAARELELRMPALLPRAASGKGRALSLEAADAAAQDVDVAYLDPPYNQHSYLGNYHVWETLVRWDEPEVYGVACKRIDCRERRSPFNSKRAFRDALESTLASLRAPCWVVSFSDEGFASREELVELLSRYGQVGVLERGQRRYVGAQIGIHDPQGRKVGEVSHLHHREFLFLVDRRGSGAADAIPG